MRSFQILRDQFQKYIGKNAIDSLSNEILKNKEKAMPMVLISGNQFTGKSTMAKNLSSYYQGGGFYSVGQMFRELAQTLGISVGEQSRLLRIIQEGKLHEQSDALKKLQGKRVDIELDYRTCQLISGHNWIPEQKYIVIEGRQPAIMGTFVEGLGKKDLYRIYLKCSAKEQALRFIQREIGESEFKIAQEHLSKLKNVNTIDGNSNEEENIGSFLNEISKLPLENINDIVSKFIENQNRDQDDRKRYNDLYHLDYEDMSYYDLIIDTSSDSSTNKSASLI
ncbi:hypothetical protein DLAC_02404 [Tieghemostelium lacteum]|uniref:(d)CMP kinase n=1 Tax=Tieghemostelium lacteum TaxID=361077 RepID=A0A152A5C1_TIELA|nr:hypothetical protein DLAC_02404 [Tieghemostelium lacteum]|eukprot:KYR01281.1 hypothetical protein DLAC_02404 [Tieghemostelium lacteum]